MAIKIFIACIVDFAILKISSNNIQNEWQVHENLYCSSSKCELYFYSVIAIQTKEIILDFFSVTIYTINLRGLGHIVLASVTVTNVKIITFCREHFVCAPRIGCDDVITHITGACGRGLGPICLMRGIEKQRQNPTIPFEDTPPVTSNLPLSPSS